MDSKQSDQNCNWSIYIDSKEKIRMILAIISGFVPEARVLYIENKRETFF